MTFEQILFYVFAAILVFSAGMVISVRNPIHAILFLVLAFFTSAALWLMLEAEFLAITLVLVYVGAVMVLFLFVVMMLDLNTASMREGFARYLPVGITVAVMVAAVMVLAVGRQHFGLEHVSSPVAHGADYSNTRELGLLLYTTYVYPFEIAAVILLVAIVAAIALTLRQRGSAKSQNVAAQVAVRRDDRVRLVQMDAEQRK
ncbi:MAG: NADH-quinone oxidoreductase subunit J [Gammaproteobacteria bacterium HGW-Gammaproteobacteria-1]|jgi:NADH-quinone oxidoreductase subunit J|nr:MAG: NADH-quinone oxidoreductase subunit J [Gammaproteobacteria bacterium HGW-Gammaproteobacteria-1]